MAEFKVTKKMVGWSVYVILLIACNVTAVLLVINKVGVNKEIVSPTVRCPNGTQNFYVYPTQLLSPESPTATIDSTWALTAEDKEKMASCANDCLFGGSSWADDSWQQNLFCYPCLAGNNFVPVWQNKVAYDIGKDRAYHYFLKLCGAESGSMALTGRVEWSGLKEVMLYSLLFIAIISGCFESARRLARKINLRSIIMKIFKKLAGMSNGTKLAVVAVLILGFLFYWFAYRPSAVRSYCAKFVAGESHYDNPDFISLDDCMSQRGIKP